MYYIIGLRLRRVPTSNLKATTSYNENLRGGSESQQKMNTVDDEKDCIDEKSVN